MNNEAINQFKTKTNDLITILYTFLKWVEETEQQDKLYESKMKQIASQNKTIESNRSEVMEKEKAMIARETQEVERERLNRKKQEELILKEGNLNKEREQINLSKIKFEKEKQEFEKTKLNEDILINMKNQVLELQAKLKEEKALLEAKEKLNDDRNEKLRIGEEKLKKDQLYLNNLLK